METKKQENYDEMGINEEDITGCTEATNTILGINIRFCLEQFLKLINYSTCSSIFVHKHPVDSIAASIHKMLSTFANIPVYHTPPIGKECYHQVANGLECDCVYLVISVTMH